IEQLKIVGCHALVPQVSWEGEHHDLHHGKPGQPQTREHMTALMPISIGKIFGRGKDGHRAHECNIQFHAVALLDLDQPSSRIDRPDWDLSLSSGKDTA